MLVRFTVCLALMAAAALVQANDPDVPVKATHEIDRRGAFVQELGTIQADEFDVIADALAPPQNDSFKWFISVVYKKGDAASDKLRKDIATSPIFRAWIHVDKPAESFVHYHERDVDDDTQKSWFKGIQSDIDKGDFPIIVLQPPKNGSYGPNKTIVAVIHGYEGDPKTSVKKLRDAISIYIRALLRKNTVSMKGDNTMRPEVEDTGHAQMPPVGAVPPFHSGPNTAPRAPVPSFPPAIDEPTALTLEQIQTAVPNATADFYLDALKKKPTTFDSVKLAWFLWEKDHAPTPVVAPEAPKVEADPPVAGPAVLPPAPPTPSVDTPQASPDHLTCLFSGGTLISVIVGILVLLRALTKNRILTDEQMTALLGMLKRPSATSLSSTSKPKDTE